jgi:DNA-binding SARP family transcriptional activator/tetratricopeptide (TPR) repeat protein
MRFGLLGPLTVADVTDRPVEVPGARLRILLAALLLHANTPVSADALADTLWDGVPPDAAAQTLRSHVARLRRLLGAESGRVSAHEPGYLIHIEPAELDVAEFESWCRAADAALCSGAWSAAADAATRALGLWRAGPLLDVPSPQLHERLTPHVEQLRLQVLEDGAQAELHLGRHERLIPRLRDLTALHPLRERFHAQLMLALVQCGRQGEALAAYQGARRVLVDQLGIEPGRDLRALHERILAGDSDLLTPPPSPSPPLPTSPSGAARCGGSPGPDGRRDVPRQLPTGVRHFVGRTGELKALGRLLTLDSRPGGAVVVSAIDGTAGVGKTALAVHWAHLHADRFPDGQLYVNLRGFDPSSSPMTTDEAVRGFLAALGAAPQRVPADPDEQAALYRSRLADLRMLIVLDNARDAAQIRPLLPGAPGCLVLITSRNRLAELVALDGAVPLSVGLLTVEEARDLLADRLGAERARGEAQAIESLIGLCARLPLALNIAAARAALNPARPLATLVDELRDGHRHLATLSAGSGTADVRAVFSWSYRTLAPETMRVFRLLGLHSGPDLSLPAVASLAALDVWRTRGALDELARAHLVDELAPGRYSFHDLLRAYAAECAHAEDSEADRDAALRRVCDFYLHAAQHADRLLHPHRPLLRLGAPAPGVCVQRPADMAQALAWFDSERLNLLAAQRTAIAHAWHAVVWQLAWTSCTFHVRRGHRHDELAAWRAALSAVDHLAGPSLRTGALRLLGRAYADLDRHGDAIEHLRRALALAEGNQNPVEQAHTHRTLAWAWERAGDLQREAHHARRALDLYRTVDQPVWEADMLHVVGSCAARLGHYATARADCQAALALHRRYGHLTGEADTLHSLGSIEHRTGHYRRAVDHYLGALTLRRALGNTYQAADTLDQLAHAHAALDRQPQARAAWQQALDLYRQHDRTEDAERVEGRLRSLGPA